MRHKGWHRLSKNWVQSWNGGYALHTDEQKSLPESEDYRDPWERRKQQTHCIHGLIFTKVLGEEIPSRLVLDRANRTLAAKPKPDDQLFHESFWS